MFFFRNNFTDWVNSLTKEQLKAIEELFAFSESHKKIPILKV